VGRPLSVMRRARPEQAVQAAIFQHLPCRGAPGIFAFHPANGGWRSPIEAAILQGLGVRAGVPDVIAVKDGRRYALEIKLAAGAVVVTSYGLHDAVAQLERWGLLRGQASLPPKRVWEQRRQRLDPARREGGGCLSLASAGVSPRHQDVRRGQGEAAGVQTRIRAPDRRRAGRYVG
jgi:hypothetical protein